MVGRTTILTGRASGRNFQLTPVDILSGYSDDSRSGFVRGLPTLGRIGLMLGTCLLAIGGAIGQESTNYTIERLTVTAGAGHASSTRFDAEVTIGQTVPAGAASFCNNGYAVTLGFWSARGETPTANLLFVSQSPVIADQIDLTWSGATQAFEVYRGPAIETLLDPANLYDMTTTCSSTDDLPLPGSIVFYRVYSIPD